MTTPVDATEDDLRAVAEVLKFAAILDDRAPAADKNRIIGWAEQVHRHRLGRDDLVDGLQAYYDTPHTHAIGIGDLIQHARAIRRDRNERETSAARDRRAEQHDTRAADTIHAIGSAFVNVEVSADQRTPRLEAAEYGLETCHGRQEGMAAIREYVAAKAEAKKQAAAK